MPTFQMSAESTHKDDRQEKAAGATSAQNNCSASPAKAGKSKSSRPGLSSLRNHYDHHNTAAKAALKHGIILNKIVNQAVDNMKAQEPMITMSQFGGKVIINDAQYNLYKSEFDSADGNGDGELEVSEVRKLLKSKLGEEATHEQLDEWLKRVDENHDGNVSLEEWIRAIIGKDFSVSHTIVKMVNVGAPGTGKSAKVGVRLPEDKDGNPMCIGLIYEFTGGGGYGGDVCVFRGMRSAGSGLVVAKSTTQVDGIGQFSGHGIITRNFSKLKLVTEKDAWASAQGRSLVEVNFFMSTGDSSGAAVARKVARAYREYTGVRLRI